MNSINHVYKFGLFKDLKSPPVLSISKRKKKKQFREPNYCNIKNSTIFLYPQREADTKENLCDI